MRRIPGRRYGLPLSVLGLLAWLLVLGAALPGGEAMSGEPGRGVIRVKAKTADGKVAGKPPVTDVAISPGMRRIEVKKEGCEACRSRSIREGAAP